MDKTHIKNHNTEVAAVVETISSMVNLFEFECEDLVNIVNGEVATSAAKKDLLAAESMGEEKLARYLDEKVTCDVPDIFSPIKATKQESFTIHKASVKAKTSRGDVVALKNDGKFIARMLAIGQSRKLDMERIMKYSLCKCPQPFATYDVQLIKTPKVKLMHAIEDRSSDCTVDTIHPSSASMLDGMAMIQTQKYLPQTFGAYAEDVLNQI